MYETFDVLGNYRDLPEFSIASELDGADVVISSFNVSPFSIYPNPRVFLNDVGLADKGLHQEESFASRFLKSIWQTKRIYKDNHDLKCLIYDDVKKGRKIALSFPFAGATGPAFGGHCLATQLLWLSCIDVRLSDNNHVLNTATQFFSWPTDVFKRLKAGPKMSGLEIK